MAFKTWGTLSPNEGQMLIGGDTVPQRTIIVDSGVMQIGDKVEWSSGGYVQTGAGSTTTTPPIGICMGVAQNGIGIDPDAGTTDTFTVASDNTTVLKKYAIIDISTNTLYSVQLDDPSGTTTGSGLAGFTFDAVSSAGDKIDESTSVIITTASGSFFSWGLDPATTVENRYVIVNMTSGSHHREIA